MMLDEKFNFLLEDCVRFIPDFKLSDYDELTLVEKFELDELIRDSKVLSALEAGGVDNWEWYGESLKDFFDEE